MTTRTVYVALLDEGTFVARPTQAIPLEDHLFKLLPVDNYDPEDEHWEFTPGAIVRIAERRDDQGETYFLAVKP